MSKLCGYKPVIMPGKGSHSSSILANMWGDAFAGKHLTMKSHQLILLCFVCVAKSYGQAKCNLKALMKIPQLKGRSGYDDRKF